MVRGGEGEGQILHYQLVSTTLKTHHKKFQLNQSRNGWVIKNSENMRWVVVVVLVLDSKQELSHVYMSYDRNK